MGATALLQQLTTTTTTTTTAPAKQRMDVIFFFYDTRNNNNKHKSLLFVFPTLNSGAGVKVRAGSTGAGEAIVRGGTCTLDACDDAVSVGDDTATADDVIKASEQMRVICVSGPKTSIGSDRRTPSCFIFASPS